MAINFPNGATNGQKYTAGNGSVYRFDGQKWVVDGAKDTLSSVNNFTASYYIDSASFDSILDNLVSATSSYLTSETDSQTLSINGTQLSISNGNTITIPTGSTLPSGVISGSSQLQGTTIQNLSGSFTGSFKGDVVGSLTGTALYSSNVAVVTTNTTNDSTLYPVFTNTSASNANNTLKNHPSGTFYYDGITRKVYGETFVGAIEATNGIISGSSQLTASYDTRYTLSGSVQPLPSGLISGSSQLTSSLDIRYAPSASYLTSINGAFSSSIQTLGGSGVYSSSVQLPSGIVSGSSQLTSSFDVRYTLSGSVVSGTTPLGTVSGSSQLTSSYDGRYVQTGSFNTLTASFNSFTSSAQAVTTGSNSFNGTQTITGSLVITSGSFIGSQILANTSSLYLTSGSNLYLQNNGVVEITGSMIVSGSTNFKNNISVGTGSLLEGGEIDLAYAQSGNTTLTGSSVAFDVYGDKVRIFEGGGNSRGVSIDLSKAPTGVGGDLMWKTSGLLNTGSYIQMDNIKAGPTRNGAGGSFAGLSIGAVSTSFVADVSATYANNAVGGTSITNTTYTTTPGNAWNGWGFAQGQHSTYIVNDTTNGRVYRIILMIGASYNNNFTSIERLY